MSLPNSLSSQSSQNRLRRLRRIPSTADAFQSTFNGGSHDGVLAKLSADGSSLLYATYLGGSGADWIKGIALDNSGNPVVFGMSESSDFPT